MTAMVRDARPPGTLLRFVNPVLVAFLRTPVGRLITPLALLEFSGRRSAKRYRVVVGWHELGDQPVVVTPASWRANFTSGAPVVVRWRGRRHRYVGTLDADPTAAASAINALLATGTSARALALGIPAGHIVTSDDVTATRRAVVRFHPAE